MDMVKPFLDWEMDFQDIKSAIEKKLLFLPKKAMEMSFHNNGSEPFSFS